MQTGHRVIIPQPGAAFLPDAVSGSVPGPGGSAHDRTLPPELRFCGSERQTPDGPGGSALASAQPSMRMSARGRRGGHERESGDGGGPQLAAEAGVLFGVFVNAVAVEDGVDDVAANSAGL